MGAPSRHRYPLEPLLAITGMAPSELAAALGQTTRSIQIALRRGGWSEWRADRAACAIGLHPADIWGWDWFEDALEDARKAS